MTMREFMNMVIENTTVTSEMVEFAKAQIAKLDERNEKRKTSPTVMAKAAAAEELQIKILDVLSSEPMVAKDIAKAVSTEDIQISTAKVSAMLKKLNEAGKITVGETKIGSRTVKCYSI